MSTLKKVLKKILPVLILLPLAIGTTGYLIAGEMLADSLYASFALYFVNPVSDEYNLYVEIARWTAPLVTATTILCALQSVWESLRDRLHLLGKKDRVAVYSDEQCDISFGRAVGAIYPGAKFRRYADSHIIMFSSDKKSLQFYEDHREDLAGKDVYVGIRDVECILLDHLNKVTLFDVNGAIARLLWKDIALWNRGMDDCDIVIYGNSNLAGDIVCAGLQLNLFSLRQKVRYHIITDNKPFQTRHSDIKLMNDDEMHFYDTDHSDIWSVISSADLVIVADILEAGLMQTIVVKAGESPIYYYSQDEGDLASFISYGSLIPFGRNDLVFTDDNIRRKKLIRKAIALNEYYADKYGTEKEWDSLTGFLKASNISASDFGEVLAALSESSEEDELARLEHIRWCRFHYLNYYTLGTPDNGKSRDDKRRIHKDLVAYEELDPAEQLKDIESIRITRNL